MSEQTIFQPVETKDGVESTPPAIVIPDNVKDMIGEGKKYADVAKALEALGHSQTHIARIEEENKTLREATASGITQNDVLRTVQEMLATERATHGTVPASVDESVLDTLLERKLTAQREAAIANANTEVVKKALVEKYADKAEEIYKTKAEELGVGVKFLNDLVAKSPKAAFDLLGLEPPKTNNGTVTTGSVNTSALRPQDMSPKDRPSVMRGAKTADIVAEWRRHDPTKKQE